MTRPTTLVLIYCLLSLAFVACGKSENTTRQEGSAASPAPSQSPSPQLISSASVVQVRAPGVEVDAGSSTEASVVLTIASGYHVNANPPSQSYLIPTELTVEPTDGMTAGKPVYPQSVTRKFPFDPNPFAVYEGETTIKLPLKVASTATKGTHTLNAKLRVQACDDKACYRPGEIATPIPVTIK
jgi:hypothetical protein